MLRKTIVVLAFLFLCNVWFHSVYAQTAWTLEQCISYAYEHSIQLKKAELYVAEAKLELKQSKLNFIPTINTSGALNTSVGRVLDPTTYDFLENETVADMNIVTSFSTELFAGLAKHHKKEKAALNLKKTLLGIDKARKDLALNITAAYLEILIAKENIEINKHKIALLDTQIIHTQSMIDVGKLPAGDLFQVKAEISNARNDLMLAENRLTIALLDLCQLLEIEDIENFNVVEPHSDIPHFPNVTNITGIATLSHTLPEIEMAGISVDMAQKDVDIAKSNLFPTLSMSGGYGSSFSDARKKIVTDQNGNFVSNDQNEFVYTKYPFRNQFIDNASAYISLTLNIPIFNSAKVRNQIKSLDFAKEHAELDADITQKQLLKEIQQAIINSKSAYERYNALIDNLVAVRDAFSHTEKKLENGSATYYEYAIALDNLIQTETSLAQAKYECVFRDKIIDFYMGKPLN
ncbi:MAG: TolC family protein [Bacteroidales bacterium]|nr:TolC family protein [Bacteroidales bacterium]